MLLPMSTVWWLNEMLDLWLSTTRQNTSNWQPQTKSAFYNDHLCFMINRREKYSTILEQWLSYCSPVKCGKLVIWWKRRVFFEKITTRLWNVLHDRFRIKILSKCQVIQRIHWIVSLSCLIKYCSFHFHRIIWQ